MIVYSMILLLAAAVLAVMAVKIYKGNTDLIHDYHQTKVEDKAAYGRSFGKALGLFPVTMVLSAAAALLGENRMGIAVAILLVGIAAGIGCILRVQKKFNGGLL